MTRAHLRWILASIAVATLLASSAPSPAGPSPSASTTPSSSTSPSASAPTAAALEAARRKAKEGFELFQTGDYSGALAKFYEVAQVKATPQIRFNIARCRERLGQLVDALAEYENAEQQAKADSMASIEKAAGEAAAGLRPRIPKLTLKVDPSTAVVKIDGTIYDASKEIALDPGAHSIEVSAPKRQPTTKKITLAEKDTQKLVISLAPAK
jgi:tetratricopeptide (TPR) repeat protein